MGQSDYAVVVVVVYIFVERERLEQKNYTLTAHHAHTYTYYYYYHHNMTAGIHSTVCVAVVAEEDRLLIVIRLAARFVFHNMIL